MRPIKKQEKLARFALVALFTGIALVASACSAASLSIQTRDGANPPRFLAEQVGVVSDYQAAILSDGEVTYEEYEQAFFDYSDCLVEQGAEVSDPLRFDESDQDWKGSWYDPTGRFEEYEAECYSEYFSLLQDWWNWQIQGRKSEAEMAQEAAVRFEILVRCLQENGVATEVDPKSPSGVDLNPYMVAHQDIYGPCWERATPGYQWQYLSDEDLDYFRQQSNDADPTP